GEDGYLAGPDDGYPGQDDTGYHAADDYAPGHDQPQPSHDRYGRVLREGSGDHGYGDAGGWYGDVDEDQAWRDDEDDSGLLPGFSGDTDYRRARPPSPARHRRPPPAPRRRAPARR